LRITPGTVLPATGVGGRLGLLSRSQLDALVEEAMVDCYNEDEQLTGLFTMIEDNLAVPFTTRVLGVEVTVRRVASHPTGSWRSAIGAASGRRSGSWTCRCRTRRPMARSGSRHTATGSGERP
jgi:hypothetical protein